jgi:exodeoxyribonuclease VII large subunit
LHAVSPLATLDRGYAIVTDATGRVLQRATETAPGTVIDARLAQGSLRASVLEVRPANPRADER